MIIEDEFAISNPIGEVWDFFLDIPGVSTCVPGVEKVEQVDDETFAGTLAVKVGPIAANFDGRVVIADMEPPRRLVARAEGKDKRTASMVSAAFTATLNETAPDETEVAYQIDVTIRGRLGQFGQGVIRETARQMTRAFAACVQARLAEKASEDGPPAPGPQPDAVEANRSAAPSAPREAWASDPPSLLTIILRAIITSIRTRVRVLWSGSGRPAD